MVNYFLAFIAGIVSILSPCILPLLPILITSGLQSSGWKGIFGLPLGMAFSFAFFGTLLASIGNILGLNSNILNLLSATLLIIFGIFIISEYLQKKWIILTKAFGARINQKANNISASNFKGQFLLGLLLGLAWTPCIGPTIGAAITLASKGQNLLYAFCIMSLFALGATLPIIFMSFLSQKTLFSYKKSFSKSSKYLKFILGIFLIVWGIFLIFSIDKKISAWLLNNMPSWINFYL